MKLFERKIIMAKAEEKKVRKKTHRSPNFPAVSLKKAVELTGQLYGEYKKHEIPVNLVHKAWDYAEHGSAGNRCIAAIKSFGLIEVIGSGKTRKIKVSENGHRIHGNAPDIKEILKKAALLPLLHAELWNHFNANIPNDDLLKNYLLWEHQPAFNEQSVSGFISEFRDTISYAKLGSSDIIGEKALYVEDNEVEDKPINDRSLKMPPITGNTFDQPIPLPDGSTAVLRMPRPMSDENFTFIEKFLELIKPNIVFKPKLNSGNGADENNNIDDEK